MTRAFVSIFYFLLLIAPQTSEANEPTQASATSEPTQVSGVTEPTAGVVKTAETSEPVAPVAQASIATKPRPRTAKTWIQIRPLKDVPAWEARAFEGAIYHSLADEKRLHILDELPSFSCSEVDVRCFLKAARKVNVDLVVLGELSDHKLTLRSFDTWTQDLLAQETFHLPNAAHRDEFRHQIYRLVKPMIQLGGVLDRQALEESLRRSQMGNAPEQSPKFYFNLHWSLYLFVGSVLGFFVAIGSEVGSVYVRRFLMKVSARPRFGLYSALTISLLMVGFVIHSVREFREYRGIYSDRMAQIKLDIHEQQMRLQQEKQDVGN